MGEKTILLVDDDVDVIEANRLALEAAGYRVLTAHDGAEALALVEEHDIHGAVLDVMMKTRDEGFHLARMLRKTPRTRTIPLLMLTGVNAESARQGHPLRLSDDDRDEVWLPVDRFLDKPVSPARLVALLRELVG
jgi:CheY-like chemotaxis protein